LKRKNNPPKAKEREEKVTEQIDVALGKVSFKDRDVSPIFISRIISTRLGSLGMVTLAFLPSIAVNFACPAKFNLAFEH